MTKDQHIFEDRLISAADFLYHHNMGSVTDEQRYNILLENGYTDLSYRSKRRYELCRGYGG